MSNKNKGPTLYFSQFGGERPIPEQFIAAMDRAEERTKVPIDSELPELSDEIVEARFDPRYENTNEKWLVVVRKKAGVIGPLLDRRTTDQGQSVQVEATMFRTKDDSFVRSFPSSTQDVSVKDLGNGWSIQEVAVAGTWVDGVFVPGIFQGIELSTRREDPIPNALSSGLPVREVQSIVEGTVAQPTLGANDLTASQRQLAQSKKLLSTLSRDPIALPKTVKYLKELTDLLPARFRGLVPTERTSAFVSGTAAPVTLGVGELLRSEEQVTALVKVVEVLSRAGVVFPVIVVETATITEYGGGKVTITSSIAVEGTYIADEGEGFVSSKITKLGEGHELKETVARVAGSWPQRAFADLDETNRTLIAGTKQVVAKGSTTAGVSGDVVTEIKDIDGYREDKIIRNFPTAALDAYFRVLHTNTNIDLPAVLTNVNSYMQAHGGDGSYSELGAYSIAGNGSGGVDLSGHAQASAVIIPEIGYIIRTYNGSNVPCRHVLFLAPFGTTRATLLTMAATVLGGGITVNDWPKFSPQAVTLICRGQTSSIKINSTQRAHSSTRIDYLGVVKSTGDSRSAGTGVQREVGADIKLVRISPCIHGSLSVGGDGSSVTPASYSAIASINSGAGQGTTLLSATVGVTGTVAFVQGSAPTPGTHQDIPSGTYYAAHRLVTEADETRNRIRVMVEVINFADVV